MVDWPLRVRVGGVVSGGVSVFTLRVLLPFHGLGEMVLSGSLYRTRNAYSVPDESPVAVNVDLLAETTLCFIVPARFAVSQYLTTYSPGQLSADHEIVTEFCFMLPLLTPVIFFVPSVQLASYELGELPVVLTVYITLRL